MSNRLTIQNFKHLRISQGEKEFLGHLLDRDSFQDLLVYYRLIDMNYYIDENKTNDGLTILVLQKRPQFKQIFRQEMEALIEDSFEEMSFDGFPPAQSIFSVNNGLITIIQKFQI